METPSRITDFSNVPSNRFFGIRMAAYTADSVTLEMDVRPEFIQEEGVVHGAILTAIADTAAVYLYFPYLEEIQKMTSIEFKVNFIAAAIISGKPIRAIAKSVRKGKRIGVADVEVFQGEKIILKGLFTYLFF